MNPMTNMKNVLKLSEQELRSGAKSSWHDQYRHSAWVFVGGLPYDLTEGDIICVFSQYGEVVNINLVRDKGTGKSKGFCFLCYEDQRSTNLAVDNFNGFKLLNRTIRVDHCENYKAPKDDKMDEDTQQLHAEGCAPGSKYGHIAQLPSSGSNGGLDKGLNLPPMESLLQIKKEKESSPQKHKEKVKKEKKSKKPKEEIRKLFKKKRKEQQSSSSSSSEESSDSEDETLKRKSVKKSKQKKQDDSSSSSEESEAARKSKQLKKKSQKSSSSESDKEDLRRADTEDKSKGKEYDRQRVHQSRPDGRISDDFSRHHKVSRVHAKDSSSSHRAFKDFDKDRGEGFQRPADEERGGRNRQESRSYATGRGHRDSRRENRDSESTRERYREYSKDEGDRRRRDDRWESDRHKRSDEGGRR